MNKGAKEELAVRRKMVILEYAQLSGNTSQVCREYAVPRSSFYQWKKAVAVKGHSGLYRKKPIAHRHPRQISPAVVEQILQLRDTYHLGPQRIAW
jgi:hypothetical protein